VDNFVDLSKKLIDDLNFGVSWNIEQFIKYMQIINIYQSHVKKHGFILDLGCGNGNFIKFYQLHFRQPSFKKTFYIGIDGNKKYIENCKEWISDYKNRDFYKTTKFIYANLNENMIWDKIQGYKIDIILALEVIEHLNDCDLFIKRIANLLNYKSIFIISTPVHYNSNELIFRKTKNVHLHEFYYKDFCKLISKYFHIRDSFGTLMETNEFKKCLKKFPDYKKMYEEFKDNYVPSQILIPLFELIVSKKNNKMENLTLICEKKNNLKEEK